MIPDIKKILYTTDLSENSREALDYTVHLAEKFNAQIIVLHVMETISVNTQVLIGSYLGTDRWDEFQKTHETQLLEDLKNRLKNFCDDSQSSSPACQIMDENIIVSHGVPMEEILNTADARQVDLIVMGTHGYGMVKDALLGGTVRRVVRRSLIPVLVIPSPARIAKGNV